MAGMKYLCKVDLIVQHRLAGGVLQFLLASLPRLRELTLASMDNGEDQQPQPPPPPQSRKK